MEKEVTKKRRTTFVQSTLLLIAGRCRICGASFESTDDARQLCDEHLVERINGAGLLEDDDDDLFNVPRRAPIATARITCRVCERTASQPIDTPGLLCPLCREDLVKTEQHIRQVLAAAELAFINAYDLHQANVAHADEQTQARYERVQEALGAAREGTTDPASVRRRYEAARAKGDELSALLRERDAAEAVAEEYTRLQAWAERAMGEVEAAR